MNEELKEKLLNSYDSVENWLESGAGFVGEQVPLIIDEIIWWGLASHSFLALLFAGIYGVCWYVGHRANKFFIKSSIEYEKNKSKSLQTDCEWGMAGWILGKYVGLFWLIFVFTNLYQVVFILCAPRLYVLEQVKEFVVEMQKVGG